jgi:RNA polymerase sigma-70 factor (ECF subfamily)
MTTMLSTERERFAEIARRCEASLLRQARRLTRGNEDVAQDLVQDALVRAYEAFRSGRFLEGFQPCAWLARIVTNLFINDYRRRQKWEAGVTVDNLTAGGDTGPTITQTPETVLLTQGFEEPVERALHALPESLRITVLLVDVHEYSYQEAAEALQIPVGTVRSRLARARFQLQETLAIYAQERGLT